MKLSTHLNRSVPLLKALAHGLPGLSGSVTPNALLSNTRWNRKCVAEATTFNCVMKQGASVWLLRSKNLMSSVQGLAKVLG